MIHHEEDHHTVIAQIDERKYISICEHGTLHLVWGMVTLRFRPQDFAYVVHLLEQGLSSTKGQEIVCGPVRVKQDENGSFALRIIEIELYLNAVDYPVLVEIAKTALKSLKSVFTDSSGKRLQVPQKLPKRFMGRSSFSLN